MKQTDQLNNQFGIPGKLHFENGKGDLVNASIKAAASSAVISLYGAQALSFIPNGKEDILWMSKRSLFEQGKAIRGGIPVCFPWFGPHADNKKLPQHGFARLQYWEVKQSGETADGRVWLELSLKPTVLSQSMWPFEFEARMKFVLSSALEVQLTVTNTGKEKFRYTDALHSYFNIGDISTIKIAGLEGARYYDGFDTDLKTQEPELLDFSAETNRRYVFTDATCLLHDKKLNRTLCIEKTGSKVTVVWNPWKEITLTMSDMEPTSYKNFVCIEPANAYEGIDVIGLRPGESHVISTKISLQD